MDDSSLVDDHFDMANLQENRTGIPGVVWISTRMGRHGPRVKYFLKPGSAQPSFAVSIADPPVVVAGDLPGTVVSRVSPQVIEWVRLNQAALLDFWHNGDSWLKEQVDAHIDGLKKLEP